jgi:polysaccharide biosynthesis protein VpsQ
MIRIALLYGFAMAALIGAADAGWLIRLSDYVQEWPHLDKVLHFTLYGVLALLANLAVLSPGRWSTLRSIVTGSAFVLIVATAEEYSNQFVAVRDYSLGDLVANYLGVMVVGVLPLLPWLFLPRRVAQEEMAQPPADS